MFHRSARPNRSAGEPGKNPVELNRCLNGAAGRLLKINREKGKVKHPLLSGGWPGLSGLISARFLLLGNRPVSAGLILRQCAPLFFSEKTIIIY
jgi:hypothetical protein